MIMKATLSPVEGYKVSFLLVLCHFHTVLQNFDDVLLLPARRSAGGEGAKIDFSAVAGRFLNNEGIKQKSLISARVIKRTAEIS